MKKYLKENCIGGGLCVSMYKNNVVRNIAKVFASNFVVTVVGFLGVFVFPNIMSIESYAYYQTFILYVGYTGIFHLGFPSGLAVEYAGKRIQDINKKKYKAELNLLCIILVFFTLSGVILYMLTENIIVLYISISIFPTCIIASYKSLYQAFGEFNLYTKINVLIAIIIPIIPLIYYALKGDLPGSIYVFSFLSVNIFVAASILQREYGRVRGSKSNKLLSESNWNIEKVGFLLVLGGYVNVLFLSLDKQFIKLFFSTEVFAYYAFAMSTKAIMTVLITSISQPLFPAMAQKRFSEDQYSAIKEMLLVIGSLSGCAYFAVEFIVNQFIQKYVNSLEIVGIYFMVFPAMAVIQCLYINLYKIKKLTQLYIKTLIGIIGIAVILNLVFLCGMHDYRAIAIATVLTYYIWLIVGSRQMKLLAFTIREYIYIVGYLLIFIAVTRNFAGGIGFMVYLLSIMIFAILVYGKRWKSYL